MTQRHDLLVDSKSGPWLRTRHTATASGTLVLDNRCGACRTTIENLLDKEKDRPVRFVCGLTVKEAEAILGR